jgi:hypothetical protein
MYTNTQTPQTYQSSSPSVPFTPFNVENSLVNCQLINLFKQNSAAKQGELPKTSPDIVMNRNKVYSLDFF